MANTELDAIDRRILAILQENGRLSNQEIAERINLSPSPCLRRIRRLEESGVIRGYVALLDAQRLGLDLLAYVSVRLEKVFSFFMSSRWRQCFFTSSSM